MMINIVILAALYAAWKLRQRGDRHMCAIYLVGAGISSFVELARLVWR